MAKDPNARGMAATALRSRVLAQSGVAASVTGTTAETVLATISIPAGTLGPNSQLEIVTLWTHSNNANTKTLRVKLGATAFLALAPTTTATTQVYNRIANRGVLNSQIGYAANTSTIFGTSGNAPVTSVIDTGSDVTLTITAQCSNAADTVTLESFLVRLSK